MDLFENQWWQPEELFAAAHAIRRSVPDHEFFSDSKYQSVREAITAADFARRRPWNQGWQVRVVPKDERFPDVELRSGTDVRPFEIVEADRKERRRGAEYRAAIGKPDKSEYYDPGEEAKIALDEIVRVIGQKAEKHYAPKPNLLVYVNLSEGNPTAIYADQLFAQYGQNFQSAWLLWGLETFRLWPNPAKINREALNPAYS